MKNFINEFKEFISKGSVLDMAIGLVMGSAFTAIVNSLVEDIIMPLVTALTGQASVEDLALQVGSASIAYGKFLQAIISFLLIAFVLFSIIKAINTFKDRVAKKEEAEVEVVEAPTVEEYLAEIRDILQNK